MQFRVRRQTLIGDILWADPYGDNWGCFSETNYGDNAFADMLSSSAGLTIISLNIQCLNSKYDEFQLFVDQMNNIRQDNNIQITP